MKVKILHKLKNNDEVIFKETVGIYKDEKIVYTIDEFKMTFEFDKHILKRESDKCRYIFDFKSLLCKASIDGFDFEIPIDLIKIDVLDNCIYIEYKIEDNLFIYDVKYENI